MRESLFEFFPRSYIRAEARKKGGGRDVYRSAVGIVTHLCSQGWAQATLFQQEVALARAFWRQAGLTGDMKTFVAQVLMANAWAPAWTNVLLAADKDAFLGFCKVTGVENLRAALAMKRGVILAHAHTLFTQLFWRWLEHEKIPEGIALWQWTWSREKEETEDPKMRAIESAREMHAAAGLLREGGLVHSVADGRFGGNGIAVPFYNRKRVFQPSFAELAVITGAPVLSVDVVLEPDGRIRIDIGKKFDIAETAKDSKEKVGQLVQEYVRRLASRWARHANNLEWFQMRRHLASPALSREA